MVPSFRDLDGIDHARLGVAALSLCALVVAVLILGTRAQAPTTLPSDTLGQESGESLDAYLTRARSSVEAASGTVFALATFSRPLSSQEAGPLLSDAHLRRVGAVIPPAGAPVALPEPTASATRADVLADQLAMHQLPDQATAVVIYSDADSLRALAGEDGVLAVEALPEDAAWGRIGVRAVGLG